MRSGGQIDIVIDMASSTNTAIENMHNVGEGKNLLCEVWSGFVVCDRSIRGEEALGFENKLHDCAEVRLENGEALLVDKRVVGDEKVEKVMGAEKKGCKKPPKPPRPPRPLSLDFAEQKLVREISELAMLKKAKADRMKILKKIKNGKSASSSSGNTFALVISLIFCIVIFWQDQSSERVQASSLFSSSDVVPIASNNP
ncbi:hypothetical protein M5K25_026566 [Dendrobium thyrsiflorum]|uniref:Uncharacterized protein n=1 Tax=Dendrobium thyrsiflorum TaxID=117978 RepID=A0ABD0TXP5_DENTH